MPALDGLRGIAVLLVMLYHFIPYEQVATGLWRPFEIFRTSAWCGVDLFFVLSGFLITGILFDSKNEGRYFLKFFARRTLRIFPLQYAMLIIVLLVLGTLKPDNFMAVHGNHTWLWLYMANIPVTIKGAWPFGLLNHFWSLAIEEQFYLVWPFVVFLCDRGTLIKICVGGVTAALLVRLTMAMHGYNPISLYAFTLCRMDGLFYGGLLALLARSPFRDLGRHTQFITAMGALSVPVLIIMAATNAGLDHDRLMVCTFGFTFIVFMFGSLVWLAAHAQTPFATWMNHPVLRFFGTYSYGLYIFNQPIDGLMSSSRLFRSIEFHSYGSALVFNLAVGFTLNIILAVISFHLFEKQFLRLKRYFA